MTEEWRAIKDFPDYAVSNLGRVKRIRDSRRKCIFLAGMILKSHIGKRGYEHYTIFNNGKGKSICTHALVSDAFVGELPAAKEPDNEQWRTISEFPDYAVSDRGRVKRITNSCRQFKSGMILKPDIVRGGYVHFRLCRNGKQKIRKCHQLVLEAFRGPRPEGCQGNHLDGKKTHNHIDNLEWATPSENTSHAHRSGLAHARKGDSSNLSKLKAGEVWLIKRLVANGINLGVISMMFRASLSNVCLIKKGKTWSHIQYP